MDGDDYKGMIGKGQQRNFGQDSRVTSLVLMKNAIDLDLRVLLKV